MSLYKNIDELLAQAGTAISNAQQTPDIQAALATFGYDEARLQAGADLLAAARAGQAAQKREYGEQYAATAAVDQARQEADAQYRVHRKLVRMVLKGDPQRQVALGLDQPPKYSFSGWLGQTRVFYTNLLLDVEALASLARFNIDQAQLEAAQVAIKQVDDLNNAQQREISEAQMATKSRDAAIDELSDWLNEFREIAFIALADNPQQLEALQFGAIA